MRNSFDVLKKKEGRSAMQEAQDIARAVHWLASNASDSGATLVVDGHG
jgi:hypothetical protein